MIKKCYNFLLKIFSVLFSICIIFFIENMNQNNYVFAKNTKTYIFKGNQFQNDEPGSGVFTKNFSPPIEKQKSLNIHFKWNPKRENKGKSGVEFRDLFGRVVFALARNKSNLLFANKGKETDSSFASDTLKWSQKKFNPNKIYNVTLHSNFPKKIINIRIRQHHRTILKKYHLPINAKNISKVSLINYNFRNIDHSQRNLNLKISSKKPFKASILANKTVYAFGDSIIQGFKYQKASFINFVGQKEGMLIKKYSVNDATILPSSNQISFQIYNAPQKSPDYVIFDGGTNDAYSYNARKMGKIIKSKNPEKFNLNTYAGSFENTIYSIKNRWPKTKIIFIGVNKIKARNISLQNRINKINSLATKKWNVNFINLYQHSLLNTRIRRERVKYSFSQLNKLGIPEANHHVFYNNPSGTHPNFLGIEKFYLPKIIKKMLQIST